LKLQTSRNMNFIQWQKPNH